MKNAKKIVIEGLVSTLSGAITFKGASLIATTSPEEDFQGPYIYISNVNAAEASTKDAFINRVKFTVQLIDPVIGFTYSQKDGELAFEQISETLYPSPGSVFSVGAGFKAFNLVEESSFSGVEKTQDGLVFRAVGQYRVDIEEL